MLPESNVFLSYLVLNATRTPTFPFLSPSSSYVQSMEGATNGNGTVVCYASQQHTFFQPEHNRKLTLFSSRGYDNEGKAKPLADIYSKLYSDEEDSFASKVTDTLPKLQCPNSLVFIAQETPYSACVFLAKDIELRIYGIYTKDYALLAFSNLQNFEQLLRNSYRELYWLYRFLPRDEVAFVAFPRRVCSRWFRWGQQGALLSYATRYAVLERHIFRRYDHEPIAGPSPVRNSEDTRTEENIGQSHIHNLSVPRA